MVSPIELPIPFNPLDLIQFKLKFSKEQIEEIKRLEDDRIREGEGKVFDVKMGWFKRGKCIVFKENGRIVIITITPSMEVNSVTVWRVSNLSCYQPLCNNPNVTTLGGTEGF